MSKIVRQLGSLERHLHKKDIEALAEENARSIVESGKYDLLRVYIELKRYETYLKSLIGHLKNPTLEKAIEKGMKNINYDASTLTISKRTKIDYSVDEQWTKLKSQIEKLTKEKKEREKFLKEHNQTKTIVDEATGEVKEEFELPQEVLFGLRVKL
ncbi:MAG: hypothetical protein KatS3mg030_482 [Saprospiraceae bacterium]|nr:MAG: hypothetical protein D6816_18705 [Bacteroidota bacterium]GIV32180.1 MAG: hypothetical protein KatS3mg030_482 [Saprospiraceae bacterium]